MFDIYSISYPGYDKFLSLSIIRPEITVLFRLFDQFIRYSALFCVSREDKNANAALADSPVEGRSNKQARGSTRLKIVLEHPCLILPRNSLSNERIVADLGMIDLQNVLDAEQNDSQEQVQKWQIRFTKMKLETLSENGNSSVITHNIDGFATISSIKQATMTSLCVDVSLGEMTGVLTDAQYALLSAALSQNLSERYINPSIESSVNGAPLTSVGESEGADQACDDSGDPLWVYEFHVTAQPNKPYPFIFRTDDQNSDDKQPWKLYKLGLDGTLQCESLSEEEAQAKYVQVKITKYVHHL